MHFLDSSVGQPVDWQAGDPGLQAEADRVAQHGLADLDIYGATVIRIGHLRLGESDSELVARSVMEALRKRICQSYNLPSLRVEVDVPQSTRVPKGRKTRTLLPHHDGQHCSFLTPSRRDMPNWDERLRRFGTSGYTTTPAHKLYQAVFITAPGHGLSVTTFYDWLTILRNTRTTLGLSDDMLSTAVWLGHNLLTARQTPGRCEPYPSLASMLGCRNLSLSDVSYHYAEDDLPAHLLLRFPQLSKQSSSCRCGVCDGETARLFCHSLFASTELSWGAFRSKYERLISSERFDLVISHNLTMLHGGLAGASDRVLQPLSLVVDQPAGEGYETWLQSSWLRGW